MAKYGISIRKDLLQHGNNEKDSFCKDFQIRQVRTCIDQIDVFARQHALEILHWCDRADFIDTSADNALQWHALAII